MTTVMGEVVIPLLELKNLEV